MLKTLVFVCTTSFALSVILCLIFIPVFKRKKAGQTILKYVETHKDKNGTPTMGGLFFILPVAVTFLIFGGYTGRAGLLALVMGLAFLAVGFLDDFIKIKLRQNEGLKSYQKIIFQLAIGIVAGVFAYVNGLTFICIPFSKTVVDVGFFIIIIDAFILIASTNCVNLTDGLDGLAGSTTLAYFIVFTILLFCQANFFGSKLLSANEYNCMQILSVAICGGVLGFLLFNVNKASVFMGDTGSLSLGGFVGACAIFTGNGLFVAIIGIMYAVSGISVIIQVLYYKKTKKRVFLMAPLHHHFQLKGYGEAKISYSYAIITFFLGVLSLITYL